MQFFNIYAQQLNALVSPVRPQVLEGAKLAFYNAELGQTLGLPPSLENEDLLLQALFSKEGALSQNAVAQKYGGHQFGHWNPQLGDGRGLLLGEHLDPQNQYWDLHLKGAGQTPYSRMGDGRAVLRSTIRECLASEALHHLGIPSSRALCLMTSEQKVQREKLEPAAMMIRISQSHIRFGHFEYFHHSQQPEKLQALFDFCFEHHFSHLKNHRNKYQALLTQVVLDTAHLIAKWQVYGFNHGVMNTDNMSIHGITFDYGPYAFLDDFQSDYICNHTDQNGRYAFEQQPGVGLWNLNAFAHAFTYYLTVEEIVAALEQFEPTLQAHFETLMAKRLGLVLNATSNTTSPKLTEQINALVFEWLEQLNKERRDYTQIHQQLIQALSPDSSETLSKYFIDAKWASEWFEKHRLLSHSIGISITEQLDTMRSYNPIYTLRNHYAQQAINAAEQGDFSVFEQLLSALQTPFTQRDEYQQFTQLPPDSGKGRPLSCSS